MISLALEPPDVAEVKRSKAMLATIVPEVEWAHFHVAYKNVALGKGWRKSIDSL